MLLVEFLQIVVWVFFPISLFFCFVLYFGCMAHGLCGMVGMWVEGVSKLILVQGPYKNLYNLV